MPSASSNASKREHDTNVCTSVNLVPMSCVIIDVLLLFPPISTELISRVMRSLVKFVKSGRYNERSCLCHDCVTRARGRERETRLAIFRDTVLPSRNSRMFLRDEVFDEDSGKKRKKEKRDVDEIQWIASAVCRKQQLYRNVDPHFSSASTSIRLRQMAPRRWSVRLSLIGRWTRLN